MMMNNKTNTSICMKKMRTTPHIKTKKMKPEITQMLLELQFNGSNSKQDG